MTMKRLLAILLLVASLVGVLASCAASLGSAVTQGMWNDPSQCVHVWPEDLGCPAVLREPGVRLCVCVCT